MTFETAFTMDTSSITYGPGVTREVGHDMKELGTRRVMVVTDPNLAKGQSVSAMPGFICLTACPTRYPAWYAIMCLKGTRRATRLFLTAWPWRCTHLPCFVLPGR